MNNLSTPPDPAERLLDSLDPQGDIDRGLAVVIAHDLPADTATALAGLIDNRVRRASADAYDRGWRDAGGRP